MSRRLKREVGEEVAAPGPGPALAPVPAQALSLDPELLFATYPGPLVLAAADGALKRANAAALALAPALRADVGGLWTMLLEVARDGRARHHRASIGGAGGRVLELTLLALGPPCSGVLILGRDVTAARDLTQALVASRQMLRDLVACSADFAFETRLDGSFGFVSPRGALGFSARELSGLAACELAAEADADPPAAPFPLTAATPIEGEAVCLKRRDGTIGEFEVSAVPVFAADGSFAGTRGICRDVSAAKASAAELARAHRALEQLARTDDLTGLLNRRAFLDELPRRLAHLRRHRRQGALLYIDLDNFKLVNDRAGHAEGDALLQAFARQTQQSGRPEDLLVRLGGDEFAIWLEEVDGAGAASRVERLRQGVRDLAPRFTGSGAALDLSVGIALSSGEETAAALLQRADEAMYQAKRQGKGVNVLAPAAFEAALAEAAAEGTGG